MLRDTDFLIGDDTPMEAVMAGGQARGLVPRDYAVQPLRPYSAVDMPLIPESEWPARIKAMAESGSMLSDIRLRGDAGKAIPSLDQGPVGYCWAHSGTHAVTALRAAMNLPYVPLSAYAVAATIKSGRDEGGWGAQGLDFITERGVPSQSFWPQGDRDFRKSRPGCWEDAALHKAAEGWVDAAAQQYDRRLSFAQVMTCLLCRVPVVADFNWWGHSVCALDPVLMPDGSFGVRIWNSWGDRWGDRGLGVLSGSRARPDGATAPRTVRAA